jgi:hypothetical protein
MTGNEHRVRRSRSLAQLQRDAALARVSRTRRVAIVGAAALTAGFAALVSAIAPGKTLRARATAQTVGEVRARARSATSNTMPPLATPGELGLQGPDQAPQASPDPSQVAPDSSQVAPDSSQVAPAPAPSDGGGAVVSGGS